MTRETRALERASTKTCAITSSARCRTTSIRGMPPDEARRQALIARSATSRWRKKTRTKCGPGPRVEELYQDVRYALRTFRHNAGFATVIVLTLALGIGANTAIFSIVNAALIRPLGFAEPERLVALHERLRGVRGRPLLSAGLPRSRARPAVVRGRGGIRERARSSSPGRGEPIRIDGAKVSAKLVLAARRAAARWAATSAADEDRPGVDVAVLSWGLWQSRYGGDRSIVGQTVHAGSSSLIRSSASCRRRLEGPRRGPRAGSDEQARPLGANDIHGVNGRRAGDGVVPLERRSRG